MLAEKLGMALNPVDADEIFAEIGRANPYYSGLAMGGFWGSDLFRESFRHRQRQGEIPPLRH